MTIDRDTHRALKLAAVDDGRSIGGLVKELVDRHLRSVTRDRRTDGQR